MVDTTNAAELVGFLINSVDTNWPESSFPDDLNIVDRDNSEVYDGINSLRDRKGELRKSNFLSFGTADETPTPRGPGYDLEREDRVSCRLEGLHSDQFGHVDSAAAFETLWENVQEAIYVERRRPLPNYHTLFIENIRHASGNHRDYFRVDFEVRFWGCEELP